MQEIIILAGPNGAGKTSFANEYLPSVREGLVFVNADEASRDLAKTGLRGSTLDLAAGRQVLATIDSLVSRKAEFMVETTLATTIYARRITSWRQAGYSVSLIFLRLPYVVASIDRVRRRVEAGGHSISEDVIRRRFSRGLENLEHVYKALVDDWCVWDSAEGDFHLAQSWDDK